MKTKSDEFYMNEALQLAKKGESWTSPNPMVGAVIVKNGKIIGRGHHHKVGEAHAEVDAIKNAKGEVFSATMYVTLEPCNHFGKTPPCTEALIKAGLKKIVCATRDTHPKAAGGIAKLQKAGIEVVCGVLEKEARELNRHFFTFHEKGRPFVSLKFAASLDGKMATRTLDSKWITNEAAREYARRLRVEHQAVLVGIQTVLADNPNLGARDKNLKDPIRIIVDSRLQIPLTADVLRDSNAIVLTSRGSSKKKIEVLKKKGIEVIEFASGNFSPKKIIEELHKRNIISVFVEGGGETIGRFLDEKLADQVFCFYAPILVGGRDAITLGGKGVSTIKEALRLENISIQHFGDNMLVMGYHRSP